MKHAFTCTACGKPLTQKTVLFPLSYSGSSGDTDSGLYTLYVTEQELKNLCRHKAKNSRYNVKLRWKPFLRLLSNSNNLNCPELQDLTLADVKNIVSKEIHKLPDHQQPPVFQRLCNAFPKAKAMYAYQITERLEQLFSNEEKLFHIELELEWDEKTLVGLKQYDGVGGEHLGTFHRVCCRCKKPLFSKAGTSRQAAVLFIAAENRFSEQKEILENLSNCLKRYNESELGLWRAKQIQWYQRESEYCSVTLQITDNQDHHFYLTLALAPEEYRNKEAEKICFFPEADAYVLCDAALGCPKVSDREHPTQNREVQDYALLMQHQRRNPLKKTRSVWSFAPMLLLFGKDRTTGGAWGPKAKSIFPNNIDLANDSHACQEFLDGLLELKNYAYYTQLFYGQDNSEECFRQLAYWILLTTGILPAPKILKTNIDAYSATTPICKTLMPEEQIKRSHKYSGKQRYAACQSEARLRLYLFDNAEENEPYLEFTCIEQMEDHTKTIRNSQKNRHTPPPEENNRSKQPIIAPKDDWDLVEDLIRRHRTLPEKRTSCWDPPPQKITFLIGNGFDVGVKLKSQYSDFYKLYTAKGSDYYPGGSSNKNFRDYDLVNALLIAQADQQPDWSYYEKWLGTYSKKDKFQDQSLRDALIDQNNNFQTMFYRYLAEREKQMIFSMSEADISKDKTAYENRIKNVRNTMLNALRTFYSEDNVGVESHRAIQSVITCKPNTDLLNPDVVFQFVCYNYSSMLNNCVQQLPSWIALQDPQRSGRIIRVHHVHGELKHYDTTALVMGVNDNTQIGNLFTYANHPDSLVKWRIMDTHDRSDQYKIGVRMILESDIIVVYGMSLGETDKIWWQLLYQWLLEKETHQLILYVYKEHPPYDPDNGTSTKAYWLKNFRSMVWSTQNNAHCESVDQVDTSSCLQHNCPERQRCLEWENCKKQIHFAIHKNIFGMDLQIEPDKDDK